MRLDVFCLATLTFILSSCRRSESSDLKGSFFETRAAFIVGTWGRDGEGGGIEKKLIPRLQDELSQLGVPIGNIYAQSWSGSASSDALPGDVPNTDKHIDTLRQKMREVRVQHSHYLALIGHSFGGWASARMSTSLGQSGEADTVFLLDPVVMLGYRNRSNEKLVRARYGKNFYQERSIIDIDPCISGHIADGLSAGLLRCDMNADIACGSKFDGLSDGNERVSYAREADGTVKKVNCTMLGRKNVPISHSSIDDDSYLQEVIIRKIKSDILSLLESSQTNRVTWQQLPGLGSDIGVFNQEKAAVLGLGSSDRHIYKWNQTDWVSVPGYAAAIDVGSDGSIWAVNAAGNIYRDNGSGFVQLPGAASDISVGADGSVWVISLYGGEIYRWNGGDWSLIPGWAKRISVGPDGNAVVVNPEGKIYRYDGTQFFELPGLATDVGVGANGSIWIIGVDPQAYGYGIYRWAGTEWIPIDGSGIAIDVDELGQAWVTNVDGQIFRVDRS